MAWVSVPDLGVHRSPQRYRRLGGAEDGASVIEYVSLDLPFRAEMIVDGDGLVVGYPGIGHRIAAI